MNILPIKTVIKTSRDCIDERNYDNNAKICPNCKWETSKVIERGGTYTVFRCKKCGCEWKVDTYKEAVRQAEEYEQAQNLLNSKLNIHY